MHAVTWVQHHHVAALHALQSPGAVVPLREEQGQWLCRGRWPGELDVQLDVRRVGFEGEADVAARDRAADIAGVERGGGQERDPAAGRQGP